ncbi:M23 family metallopeptidase [Chrysiogenes arsenatis]|uniref:M23 family metallopeptidase n=1 Tax=Chrysiogenes arsenatis TaxID=309797 RepID=UPI000683F340|nr:peptidoglycan DD-metalloendopeptidase family protein [Chrysiogenes arsenatis]
MRQKQPWAFYTPPHQKPKPRKLTAKVVRVLSVTSLGLMLGFGIIWMIQPAAQQSTTAEAPQQTVITKALQAPVSALKPKTPIKTQSEFDLEDDTTLPGTEIPSPEDERIFEATIKRGDTLSSILSSQGLSSREIHGIVQQMRGVFAAHRIRIGNSYVVEKNPDDSLKLFTYHVSNSELFHIERDPAKSEFAVRKETLQYDTLINSAMGVIGSSLSQAFSEKRLGAKLVADLENIFSWQLDFRRDITPGTSFKLVYEEKWIGDQLDGTGTILAAEIVTQRGRFTAFAYTDPNGKFGYYNEKGESIRRMFLKSPVQYTRVSSDFGNRTHPVTGQRHFHGGVDLAAPTGTPVYAVADGIVDYRGYNGNAGNMITLTHSNSYKTQYLHLSGYAPRVRQGARIKQGELIGYVGSTGRSTGPHLDFRIAKGDKYIDPMHIPSHSVDPVPAKYLADFRSQRGTLQAKLNELNVKTADATRR